MMGTMVSFAAMAVGGRELADDLSTFQILFWRSLIGLVIITLLLTRFGWAQIKSKNLKVHAFRNVVHFGSQYCWFLAISLITLAEVVALEFTTSIWTALLAMLFLGEGMSRMGVAAITIGFVGMLVIVRPGAIEVGVGALAGLGAGFGYAVALATIRFLAQRDTPLCILFYVMALQLPMGLVPALDGWIWPARDIWLGRPGRRHRFVRALLHRSGDDLGRRGDGDDLGLPASTLCCRHRLRALRGVARALGCLGRNPDMRGYLPDRA